MALSPAGDRVAAGDAGGNITIYDVEGDGGSQIPGNVAIASLAFSPDGSELVAALQDDTLVVWSVAELAPLRVESIADTGALRDLTFSPDGEFLAGRTWDIEPRVRVLRASDGTPLEGPVPTAVAAPEFSEDGTLRVPVPEGLAVYEVSNSGVGLWKLISGEQTGLVSALSPDGTYIASAGGGRLAVREAASGSTVWSIDSGSRSGEDPNVKNHGPPVLAAGDALVQLLPDATVRVLSADARLIRFQSSVDQFDYSAPAAVTPGGTKIALARPGTASISIWDLESGQSSSHTGLAVDGALESLGFFDHGRLLLGQTETRTLVWNASDAALLARLGRVPAGASTGAVILDDGAGIVSGGFWLTLGSLQSGNLLERITFPSHTGQYRSLALAPDGRTLAVCDDRGWLGLLNVDDWSSPVLRRAHESSCQVAYTQSGDRLVSIGVDPVMRVWRASDLSLLSEETLHPNAWEARLRGTVTDGEHDMVLLSGTGGSYIWCLE
jgi:WD40 repeat protein